jgi:acetyl-CoA acyltransferase
MSNAVIAGYARTPFHFARKGKLTSVRPDDLAAIVLRALVARLGIEPALIEDVVMGCAYPEGEQGTNVGRIAALLAGFPDTVGGATINRFCGSSMTAVHYAAGQIAIGAGEAIVCAGVESMTRVPQGGFSFSPNPRFKGPNTPIAEFPIETYVSMGQTAENVAGRYHVSRLDQERFALVSQQKAAAAFAAGRLSAELISVCTADGLVETDGCLRPQTTLEGLAQLKPVFGGTVTAGTASPLTDGAAAVLVCSEEFARVHGLAVLARIRATAVAAVAPDIMGMGPVPASRKALARAGLTIDDIDVVELNEAVACMRDLGIPPERTNIDGGAIALGHPLGATGARIVGKAAQILKREGKRFALATQCIGGGQGIATILEAV